MITRLTLKKLTQTLSRFLNSALSSHCALCLKRSELPLCKACHAALPANTDHTCQCCDLPLLTNAHVCPGCMTKSPAFDRVITGLKYEFPVADLIMQLKNQHAYHWLDILVEPLLKRIAEKGVSPDMISPVPLHWSRRLSRGYNQSALIARNLSYELDIPYIETIKKTTKTVPQQKLNKVQRLGNLKRCFECVADVHNQHIVLVDDVVTTGATAQTLATLLKKQGARRVEIWALARTPSPPS